MYGVRDSSWGAIMEMETSGWRHQTLPRDGDPLPDGADRMTHTP